MKIKVKKNHSNAVVPVALPQGDWFDLVVPEDVTIKGPIATTLKRSRTKEQGDVSTRKVEFSHSLIDFGIALELPKGYEAHVLPRSSTFKNFHIILGNSEGIIDNSYCGNEDTWKFCAIALQDTKILAGTRIAQFKVVLSQRATVWQKIKHLFRGKIRFVEVDNLGNTNRGGIGSTGV